MNFAADACQGISRARSAGSWTPRPASRRPPRATTAAIRLLSPFDPSVGPPPPPSLLVSSPHLPLSLGLALVVHGPLPRPERRSPAMPPPRSDRTPPSLMFTTGAILPFIPSRWILIQRTESTGDRLAPVKTPINHRSIRQFC
ncbi:hypothetical protein U9M48_003257 [Paspalum notatum var. saurae]|uniref:Uncharacterized protein n=1 Tax=Paspalum notatum var. saurae TaxID=547442 RepID=A0AAQ3SKH3_PASNO